MGEGGPQAGTGVAARLVLCTETCSCLWQDTEVHPSALSQTDRADSQPGDDGRSLAHASRVPHWLRAMKHHQAPRDSLETVRCICFRCRALESGVKLH